VSEVGSGTSNLAFPPAVNMVCFLNWSICPIKCPGVQLVWTHNYGQKVTVLSINITAVFHLPSMIISSYS
jgi:hypothetical protein